MTLLTFRDPRSFETTRPGAIGHPGFGRDQAELYIRTLLWIHAAVKEEAAQLGLSMTDLMNNILVERYRGQLQEPTPEQLAEEKTLTPAEAVAHLDPALKVDQDREQLLSHFAELADAAPLTLDAIEAEEDRVLDVLYQQQLEAAKEKATHYQGDSLSGRRVVGINDARYAEGVRLAREKKDRDARARTKRREQRRKLLTVAAIMVAPTLRKEGDPRTHRQYEQPSSWATMGGYNKRDIAEADKRTPKDTS